PETTPGALLLRCRETAACDPAKDVALVTGPLYHAAPLGLNLLVPFGAGVGMVLMDKWDAEETLRLVDRHRVTHTHLVATMFHRLLQLPPEVKARYDTSSLRWVVHGAAPTPVHVKRAMIEWWGPVLYEYYAATEGGTFFVDSREWLERPGTVGRTVEGTVAKVLDEEDREVPARTTGTIYFRAPENRFEYFKAPEKTAAAYRGDYFTMGDMGYLDEDGYLFLTGRSAELIIAGGVNIYPQEIDDVLSQHPAVYEVCTVGAPNDEWGETPVAVVEPLPEVEPDDALAQELLAFARERLPTYKRPRAIHFATDLPRLPTGKILRYKVREPFWAGRERQI
ncbi:MAG TPA: AMP-binding protein, partial [Thermoanaerobaculia bacterium]|nr:AMP-binding protein [Thermoanaerobaculia bacterium]